MKLSHQKDFVARLTLVAGTFLLLGLSPSDAEAQAVTFLHCIPTSPGVLQYNCSVAQSCGGECSPAQWTAIAGQPTLPESFFQPGGERSSAIQVSPVEIEGAIFTFVNKDVGEERWAIIQNGDSGVVTGNVFQGAGGSDVQFLYCLEPSANDTGVSFASCNIAGPCATGGCAPGDWQNIGATAEIPRSFFQPSDDRGSGLQVAPPQDQQLISKDLGAQRWVITMLGATPVSGLPVGIGPAFGNVFEIAIPPATLENVVRTNADIAFAVYQDSVITARTLRDRILDLIENPSEASMTAAREAWLAAREPYGQSEVYRFRISPIDALRDDGTIGEDGDGPEGQINAWPLAEALIDYVAPVVDGDEGPENDESTAEIDGNVIADAESFPVINPEVIAGLNELGGDERNVATGYHAIEFLLWGQDLNQDGTPGIGNRDNTPGHRPFSDYVQGEGCTNGNCDRRGQYLLAAVDLLISDLERVLAAWDPAIPGSYYNTFAAGGETSLAKMVEGMGRLGYGELAGERMNVALVANSQEDEHSCFSDNTHRDLYLNALGIQNSHLGRYVRADGRVVRGPGIDGYVIAQGFAEIAQNMTNAFADTQAKLLVIDQSAKSGTPFDLLIQESIEQEDVVAVILALQAQTNVIEDMIEALDLDVGDLRQDTGEF